MKLTIQFEPFPLKDWPGAPAVPAPQEPLGPDSPPLSPPFQTLNHTYTQRALETRSLGVQSVCNAGL